MNELPAPLILASTSPFRRELLARLNLTFQSCKPDVDETPLKGESAADMVKRLSIAKAKDAMSHFDSGLVIGSDQVCIIEDKILGKPGNFDNALEQLQHASGKTVKFLTGICLYDIENDREQSLVEPFDVVFRQLTDHQITHYLKTEQPYQCAGSFKSEGLGITLFEKLSGDDPNTLIGLPLIQLINMFNNWDIDVLSAQSGLTP
jgi:MAF protein